ncbi:MAG: hypothetical protein CMN75_02650 [Spirochaeta sp.]|nr:hypothetical protein [Spirochaeta sp.]RPG08717.1 MAG: hypothetical protein CBC32_007880 [Proteobacteria bacterium TMED72]
MRVKQGEQASLKVNRFFSWSAKAVLAMSLLALLLALGCSDSSSGSGGGGDSAETCAAGCDQGGQLSTVAPATESSCQAEQASLQSNDAGAICGHSLLDIPASECSDEEGGLLVAIAIWWPVCLLEHPLDAGQQLSCVERALPDVNPGCISCGFDNYVAYNVCAGTVATEDQMDSCLATYLQAGKGCVPTS